MPIYAAFGDYMTAAYQQAAKSPDPSSQNGAVLVSGHNIVAAGHNNLVYKGDDAEKLIEDREWKYRNVNHAERGAIFNAARNGQMTAGTWMFCPWAACMDCAIAIIEAGVTHLVTDVQRMRLTSHRWTDKIEEANALMQSHNVTIYPMELKLDLPDDFSILVSGRPWHPRKGFVDANACA